MILSLDLFLQFLLLLTIIVTGSPVLTPTTKDPTLAITPKKEEIVVARKAPVINTIDDTFSATNFLKMNDIRPPAGFQITSISQEYMQSIIKQVGGTFGWSATFTVPPTTTTTKTSSQKCQLVIYPTQTTIKIQLNCNSPSTDMVNKCIDGSAYYLDDNLKIHDVNGGIFGCPPAKLTLPIYTTFIKMVGIVQVHLLDGSSYELYRSSSSSSSSTKNSSEFNPQVRSTVMTGLILPSTTTPTKKNKLKKSSSHDDDGFVERKTVVNSYYTGFGFVYDDISTSQKELNDASGYLNDICLVSDVISQLINNKADDDDEESQKVEESKSSNNLNNINKTFKDLISVLEKADPNETFGDDVSKLFTKVTTTTTTTTTTTKDSTIDDSTSTTTLVTTKSDFNVIVASLLTEDAWKELPKGQVKESLKVLNQFRDMNMML